MLPQIGLSIIMGMIVYFISFMNLSNLITLLIQVPLGVVVYSVFAMLLHVESYEYLMSILKSIRKGKTSK